MVLGMRCRGVAQQWGLSARLTRASRGRGQGSRTEEWSAGSLLRCRVRVVDGGWQTPPRGYQGGVPEGGKVSEGWDGSE